MVDAISYCLIALTTFCFGLIVSFQLTHIHYCRKLAAILRRSINSKTIAPVLAEIEDLAARK